jgi:glycosyltransferase involved in cell wall biosynthesis
VHDVFRRSGVSRTPIEVIPNGFDPALFSPQGPTSRPQGCRKFAFLFVGGAIRRKGFDLLLDAYRNAFDPGEDVTLITHVSGLGGSYQHNSLTRNLQKMAADPRAPHIQILRDSLDDATLAGLYRGCDVFLLPYRGEGFGMPLLEAMACGKPVITTAEGPAREFCDDKSAFFIPAREEVVPDDPPPLGGFAGKFTWFEPDIAALGRLLRYAYEHPQEMADRGRLAASYTKKFTWERIHRQYRERIAKLTEVEKVASSDCVTEVSPA